MEGITGNQSAPSTATIQGSQFAPLTKGEMQDRKLVQLAKDAFATQDTRYEALLKEIPKEQQGAFKMQRYLQEKAHTSETISSILKLLHEMAMGFIRNLPRAG